MPNKYTYSDSEVLRNKFGLEDPIAAHTMETRLAYLRVAEMVQNPVQGEFDLKHLLEINRQMFQDMYDWAGELRDVPTYTTNTRSARVRGSADAAGRPVDRLGGCEPEHRGLQDSPAAAHAGNHLPLRDQLAQVVRPAGRTTSGIELAGPAVDPKVTKAALSGLSVPGSTSSSQSATVAKERVSEPRGRDGHDLG